MKKRTLLIICGILLIISLFCFTLLGYTVSVLNKEVRLKTTIEAKQKDNTSEFDNMWKKISQVTQVTEFQKNSLKEIFVDYANARTKSGGSLVQWIQESCPNIDTTSFTNLQNIIISSRDSWTMRQKELIDLNREHTQLIRTIPSSLVCSMFNRKEINITIITSSKTDVVFQTGKDNDINLFNNKAEK